jgi:hypothetical protein
MEFQIVDVCWGRCTRNSRACVKVRDGVIAAVLFARMIAADVIEFIVCPVFCEQFPFCFYQVLYKSNRRYVAYASWGMVVFVLFAIPLLVLPAGIFSKE